MEKIKELILYAQSIEINQIIELIIAISVLIAFIALSSELAYWILLIFFKKENKSEIRKSKFYKNIRIFINLLGVYVSSKILSLTQEQNLVIDKCFRILIIWTIANIIAGGFEVRIILNSKINNENNNKNNNEKLKKQDNFMTALMGNIIKIILYIVAAYLSLKEFNFDIGGLAAGLGIGGAILALAAQNIVKQLLAGFAIVSDKPFEIGDWIEVDNIEGGVENISWRSTKIRTFDNTVITLDNSVLITANIINWSRLQKRVYRTNLKLPLETPENTVEKIVNRIKFILKYNNQIIADSIHINFDKIEKDALSISIYMETDITKYWEYLEFCNKINLIFLNILETQKVKLAYPGKNIYLKNTNTNINTNTGIKNRSQIIKLRNNKLNKYKNIN